MGQDVLEQLYPHFVHPVRNSRLYVEHEEIRMPVFFDPAHYPSNSYPMAGKSPAGFIIEFIIRILFAQHDRLHDILRAFKKRQLVEIKFFYQTQLLIRLDF